MYYICLHVQSHLCNPWTVACQASLSVEFSRQEYWSGLPFSTPGDIPNPEIGPESPVSPVLAGRFFTTVTPGKPHYIRMLTFKKKSAYAFQKAANNTNLNTQCYVCLWSFPAPRVCSITTAIPGPPWGKCPQVPEDTVAYLISIPALSNVVSIIIFFSLTWRVHCLWVGSGSWWWTGKPGVLQSMGSQRVGHDWACELNWRVYCLEERD